MAEEKDENRGLSWGVLSWPQYFRRPHEIVAAFLYFLLGIVILIVLAISASILLRILWATFDFQNHTEIRSADDFNKILLGLGGLIGAVTAVPFLIWRTMIAQKQNTIAQENIHSTTMAKAIELLGARKEVKVTKTINDETITKVNSRAHVELRLGAIYLLEKLAREHEQLHWPIMEILCAYVRENAGPPNLPSDNVIDAYATRLDKRSIEQMKLLKDRDNIQKAPRVDIQAAITVIGRRSRKQLDWEDKLVKSKNRPCRLDISKCNLSKVDFSGSFFNEANFNGSSLEKASFYRSHLEGTLFYNAHLQGADLLKASLIGSFFSKARLESADLRDTHLQATELTGSHLDCANLDGARLDDAFILGTNFENVKSVTQNMIEVCWGDSDTKLPDGIVRPINERWISSRTSTPLYKLNVWLTRREYWLDIAKRRVRDEVAD